MERENIREVTFDIFYHSDGNFVTNLNHLDKGQIPVGPSPLKFHIKEIEERLNSLDFCYQCDRMVLKDTMFKNNCINCTFSMSFKCTPSSYTCTICQEIIVNDFLKVSCCGSFFHKNCRFKMKWDACPNCRCEEVRY